jgi:hypothetical protein
MFFDWSDVLFKRTVMMAAALGCVASHAAAATLQTAPPAYPAAPPPIYGAYGPLQVCGDGFGISVNKDEGIFIWGDNVRVTGKTSLFTVKVSPSRIALGSQAASGPIPLPKAMAAYRYRDDDAETNSIRYLLDDLLFDGDRPRIWVSSPLFDGTNADKAILARVSRPVMTAADCIEPRSALSIAKGTKAADYAAKMSNYFAENYPSDPIPGPAYHCQSGVGFTVEKGETILRPWKSLGSERAGPSYVVRDGITVKISSPGGNLQRADPADANEHPMSVRHKSKITYYKSRGVGPPYAEPGVRENGSWLVELGAEPLGKISVIFPAGDKARIGFRFLERLELVESNDPRCPHNQ